MEKVDWSILRMQRILQIYPNLTQGLFKDLCTGCASQWSGENEIDQSINQLVIINFMLSLLFRVMGK